MSATGVVPLCRRISKRALTLVSRVWDVVVFYVVTLVVNFTLENVGVLTGFPFGSYYYSDALGPKLGEVPILIGFSYVGAAYASWVMALILLRVWRSPLQGATVFFVPFFAAIFTARVRVRQRRD